MFLWVLFDNSAQKFQFVQVNPILLIQESNNQGLVMSDSTVNFILGIDGISLFFVILTTFLIPVCLLVGWNSIEIYVKEYAIAFLF